MNLTTLKNYLTFGTIGALLILLLIQTNSKASYKADLAEEKANFAAQQDKLSTCYTYESEQNDAIEKLHKQNMSLVHKAKVLEVQFKKNHIESQKKLAAISKDKITGGCLGANKFGIDAVKRYISK